MQSRTLSQRLSAAWLRRRTEGGRTRRGEAAHSCQLGAYLLRWDVVPGWWPAANCQLDSRASGGWMSQTEPGRGHERNKTMVVAHQPQKVERCEAALS